MRIALDAMGTDAHPEPEIYAAVEAVRRWGDPILLVGNRDVLEPRLAAYPDVRERIHIVHAAQVFRHGEKPGQVMRQKTESSLAVGMRLVKEGRADAFVTMGDTGGALAFALTVLGRIRGVRRPALVAPVPTRAGHWCAFVDVGANAECKAEYLLQFGVLASVFVETLWGRDNPRVGLLANGEEPTKGTYLVQEAHRLLAESQLNFVGNVEPKEVFAGHVDVVVTDGFTGNVVLKTLEALTHMITTTLKEGLTRSWRTKMGAWLARPAFTYLKSRMLDPVEIGAVPLLGVNGLVFIGHGRFQGPAVLSGIARAREAVQQDLLARLREGIEQSLEQLQRREAQPQPSETT